MFTFFDIIYLAGLVVVLPFILSSRKLRSGLLARVRRFLTQPPIHIKSSNNILIHAVSAGEVAAAASLIAAIKQEFPDYGLLLSTMTEAGRELARKRFPDIAPLYFPLDFSPSVRSFLTRAAPNAVILMELELWPNFIQQAADRGIPVIIANGRITEESLKRYIRIKPVIGRLSRGIAHICAQTDAYKERFELLGFDPRKISVTGNLKYDSVSTEIQPARLEEYRRLLHLTGSEPVLVGGSTYGDEEQALLVAYKKARKKVENLRLILAPRQLAHINELKQLIKSAGLEYVLKTELAAGKQPDNIADAVIILDTIGELTSIYGLADIVFVGGSLAPGIGGHNVAEPAALGRATIFGPHTENFTATVELLRSSGGALQVKDKRHLQDAIIELLLQLGIRRQIAANGQAAILSHRGATKKHIHILNHCLHHYHDNLTCNKISHHYNGLPY